MTKWTVRADGGEIVVETTGDGLVQITTTGAVLANRRAVEELRRHLGAALVAITGHTS